MHERLPFRRDLEGLRGVAILLVVAAHAGVPGLAGGFVGVDAFFVLSGFLISGLLVAEHRRTGRIELAAFYARRFRRLLPALALVLACTAVAGALVLAPSEQANQARAAAWASVWASNLHFAFANFDYFGDAAERNLVLHTWSLGVEEQFYLVWPLVLLAAWQRRASQRTLERVLWIVLVAGFAACWAWTAARPVQAFYLMPARAWEFALGALVFLRGGGLSGRTATTAGAVGLALLVLGALVADGVVYPGAWALLPALGSALLISAGTNGAGGVNGVLATRPMLALGRLSYAWYLWHWPVLLLGAEFAPSPDPAWRAVLVAVSLVLAFATHVLVERPILARHAPAWPARYVVAAAFATMFALNIGAIRWFTFVHDWVREPQQARFRSVRADLPDLYVGGCDSAAVRVCRFGASSGDRNLVLLGDSIAAQWAPALERAIEGTSWRLHVVTLRSCPMVDAVVHDARGRRYVECESWRDEALRTVAELKPEAVVVSSALNYAFDEATWRAGSARVLGMLASEARMVYVIAPTPILPFDGPRCAEPRSRVYAWVAGGRRCEMAVDAGPYGDVRAPIAAAVREIRNARFVDLTDVVCPDGRCSVLRDDRFVFRDAMHLTASFVESSSPIVAARLGLVDGRHEAVTERP